MRTAWVARPGLLVLMLSAPAMARHKGSGMVMLGFDLVEGLIVVQVETSAGRLRLLADTGSNATTLDKISVPRNLLIKVGRNVVSVAPYFTQTPVFAQFNATVPKEQRLDGVLGQDFFSQFSSVAFDHAHRRLILSR